MKYFLLLSMVTASMVNAQPPVNDNCSSAITLVVGTTCITSTYSHENATAEANTVASNPMCGFYAGNDVWFKTIMPASGALRIETMNLQGSVPPSISVYTGTCGSFTEIACYYYDRNKTINRSDLGGQTLYIRAYSYGSAVGFPFTLCVYEPEIPLNDHCSNATLLAVGTQCTPLNQTNFFATKESTTVAPNPSCGHYFGGDVWYKAAMPASGALRVEVRNPSGGNSSFSVYSGTCGNFSEISCLNLNPDRTIFRPDLTGQFVYVRVHTFDSEEGKPFTLCLFEPTIPANDLCANAQALPVNSSCSVATYTNAYATQEGVSIAPNPSCGHYFGGDVWFRSTMPASGAFRVEVGNPQGGSPPSFTLYSGGCGALSELTCNLLDADKTISRPDLAGQSIFIRVNTFDSDEGRPFTICVREPAIPANDNCVNALPLTVSTSCTPVDYSNVFATREATTVALNPSCGHYAGGDVWFTAVMPANGVLSIELRNLSGATPPSLAVYTGTCGSFQELTCFNMNGKPVIHSPTLSGQPIYLRVYRLDSEEGIPFSLCVSNTGCLPVQKEIAHSMCAGDQYTLGPSVLTETGVYSHTFERTNGCDSLVTLTLHVNEIYQRLDTVMVCEGGSATFPDGVTVNGIIDNFQHQSRLSSTHGCDSIITTQVEVVVVDTVVVQHETTLIAQAAFGEFQWFDCETALDIPEEINNTFVPPGNGRYAVRVRQQGCEGTSACIPILITGTEAEQAFAPFRIFPNPAPGDITIQFKSLLKDARVELVNALGQVILVRPIIQEETVIVHGEIPAGIYFLVVAVNGKRWAFRQVVQL